MVRLFLCPIEMERERANRARGPREHVLHSIRQAEPGTASQVSSCLGIPLPDVEDAIDELVSRGMLKRWPDNTTTGRGRVFVGTVNQHGLAEPSIDEGSDAPDVDPRTVLALVRQSAGLMLKRLAKKWPVPADQLAKVIADLKQQGHVEAIRPKRGTPYVQAVDSGWNWV